MITYTKYAPREVSVDQTVIKVNIRTDQRGRPTPTGPSRGPIEWLGQWRSLQFI
jgi:hypothetical protein